jgi:murein L,D-transpeptidase YcbB/YkuD
MKNWMLAGAACAALNVLSMPASAANSPSVGVPAQAHSSSVDQAVNAFYASRSGSPLWLRNAADAAAARAMIDVLKRAPLDGLASGPALAAQAQSLLAQAQSGDRAALARADRLLSSAWVAYVQALQTPPSGMTFADSWAAPRRLTPGQILAAAAAAQSLADHVRTVSSVNPLYAQLREAAWTAGATDQRVLSNLDRLRAAPFQKRYIMVDAASARLYMIENGKIADSMKVIVGKPTAQTPMLASTIYHATLNPYWNVPGDLVQKLIAPRVVEQGITYLTSHGYEVLSDYGSNAELLSPSKVDWKAVAAGRSLVKVRQRPGPANSMGQVKFGFPNGADIYLHDTPKKELFAQADRDISNGCIRLEDAERLSRWLMGREPAAASSDPEQHLLLPTPVPIYVTYLTAHADNGQLSFVDDVYGRDASGGSRAVGMR